MKAHDPEVKAKVLELLQKNRSLNEIFERTGITPGTAEDWAAGWRKDGSLTAYKRAGAAFTQKAKLMSNGLYSGIRKKFLNMRDADKAEGREFGIANQIEAVGYFVDEDGKARNCAYCGSIPPFGKVWGLDRLDSKIGHVPGNLVPCCGIHIGGRHLSCQSSKSCFDLRLWITASFARMLGQAPEQELVDARISKIIDLAHSIKDFSAALAARQPQTRTPASSNPLKDT